MLNIESIKETKVVIEVTDIETMRSMNILPSLFLKNFKEDKVIITMYYDKNSFKNYVLEYHGNRLRYLENDFNKKLSKINILVYDIK